jgi:hypothetical protein
MLSTKKEVAVKDERSRLITGWRQLEQSSPSRKRAPRNPPKPAMKTAAAATTQSAKDRWEAEGGTTSGKEAVKLPK